LRDSRQTKSKNRNEASITFVFCLFTFAFFSFALCVPLSYSAPGPDSSLTQNFEDHQSAVAEKKLPKLEKAEAGSPRRQASMQQVSQARGQLNRGKVDLAIRTLEKAVRLDTGNGEAFILLARAWQQKGERRKALEFAKKAELLCRKQPAKLKEIHLLESDLHREAGEGARKFPAGVDRKP